METSKVCQIVDGLSKMKRVTVETSEGKIISGRVTYYGVDDEEEIDLLPDNSSTGVCLCESEIKRIISFE